MNAASQRRLAKAREIAPIYAKHPKVQAVLVLGSASRGWADNYSDLELGVFWSEPPLDDERKSAVEQAGGLSWHAPPFNAQIEGWEEEYYVQGLKIDAGHFVTPTMDRLIGDVLDRHDASLSKQCSVSAMLHSIPLYGEPLVSGWKAQATTFPEALAHSMVREHLQFSPCWTMEMLAARDDFLLLSHNFCAIERRVILVLLGLNRVYYPGHKWLAHLVDQLELAPVDLLNRLKAILREDGFTAVHSLQALIEETIRLVVQHMPEIDTAAVRNRAWQERPVWEHEASLPAPSPFRHDSSGG